MDEPRFSIAPSATHPAFGFEAPQRQAENARMRTQRVILMLWGALFAKCFALEYLVQRYGAPVNTAIYVWTLSILFAGAGTAAYLRSVFRDPVFFPLATKALSALWTACLAAVLTFGVFAFTYRALDPYLLPALFAVVLAVGFTAHATLTRSKPLFAAALGWWATALALPLVEGPASLGAFAVAILLFEVAPISALRRCDPPEAPETYTI